MKFNNFTLFTSLIFSLTISLGAQASTPFAQGESQGLKWQVRLNLPDCQHPGQKEGAWCESSDKDAAAEKSGIENQLREWAFDPEVQSMTLAFFSFSNRTVRHTLCEAAEARNLRVVLYIDTSNFEHENVEELKNCSENTEVYARGRGPYGTDGAHLQHMKIVLASTDRNPQPLSEMSQEERSRASQTRTRFTSSSANMSSHGTSLHFENWIFFDAPTTSHIAQSNLCVFYAFERTQGNRDDRRNYARHYRDCRNDIRSERERRDLRFFVTPHDKLTPQAIRGYNEVVNGARKNIKMAVHRLSSNRLVGPLTRALNRGVEVQTVFDDDTLRASKVNGGEALDVGRADVSAMRSLVRNGGEVSFIETNASTTVHLHHNKFVVADDRVLWQGAGNFTSTAFNASRLGNYEQFYIIEIPEIVEAYSRGWDEIYNRSTWAEDHPVGQNPDR